MNDIDKIKLFQNSKIRAQWDEDRCDWLFSAVDIVAALTEQQIHSGARNYWKVLKNRLKSEGSEVVTKCNQLKMVAEDGKMRLTDCFYTEDVLRLVQSIPSKKAEPFKLWLARVGRERIDEIADPELSIERAIENYRNLGVIGDNGKVRIKKAVNENEPLILKNTAEEDEALLYEYIKQHGGVSISIATRVVAGISRRTIQRRLNAMVRKGLIEVVGATNNRKYILAEKKTDDL